jgi:hypothetical protein
MVHLPAWRLEAIAGLRLQSDSPKSRVIPTAMPFSKERIVITNSWELDAEMRRQVAAHLGGCPVCSAVADDFGRLGRKLAAVGREVAPEHLAASLRTRIAEAATNASVPQRFRCR